MTRIIAGQAGSLPLRVPSRGTRPTSDRVRESVFAALEAADAIAGARVWDLFAGTGALGLEALSRGARHASLVEKNQQAAAVIAANAARVERALGVRGAATVQRMSVETFLGAPPARCDLAFVDPPYSHSEPALAAVLALLTPQLSDGAWVIVERSSRAPAPTAPTELIPGRSRRYGESTLWWFRR